MFPGLEHSTSSDDALFGDFDSPVPSNHFFLSSGARGCFPICFSARNGETEALRP